MTLDESLTAQKCTLQGCRQGPYCMDLANTHHNISRQDIENRMDLIEAGNMEFDACNLPLNLVNLVLLNSQAKAKTAGAKTTKNVGEDSSSLFQTPTLSTTYPHYAIPPSGFGYSSIPPY